MRQLLEIHKIIRKRGQSSVYFLGMKFTRGNMTGFSAAGWPESSGLRCLTTYSSKIKVDLA